MQTKSVSFIAFLLVSSLLLVACQPGKQETNPSPSPASVFQQPTEDSVSGSSTTPAGKTIASQTSYRTPGGTEEVSFLLMVDDGGEITAAQANVMAKNPTSVMRQTSFADEFPQVLLGKNINELEKVDRIGGSSLTTGAFNQALAGLKAQL